jgi:hypothetical protein
MAYNLYQRIQHSSCGVVVVLYPLGVQLCIVRVQHVRRWIRVPRESRTKNQGNLNAIGGGLFRNILYLVYKNCSLLQIKSKFHPCALVVQQGTSKRDASSSWSTVSDHVWVVGLNKSGVKYEQRKESLRRDLSQRLTLWCVHLRLRRRPPIR